jgi:excisionase family DNA binding protein
VLFEIGTLLPSSTTREEVVIENTSEKDSPIIWTVHDVATYLRMSEAKVYRLVKQQQLPVIRIGKSWRFRKDLLDAWLCRGTASSLRIDRE